MRNINNYEGEVSDWDVHIPSLFSLIQYADPHGLQSTLNLKLLICKYLV